MPSANCSPQIPYGELITGQAATAMPTSARNRLAFTLIELVVVLALIGLAMAVVAPSLVLRPPSAEEALQRVVTSARRVAMNRAQTVTLDVDAGGVWSVESAGREAGEVLIAGKLDEGPAQPIRLRVSSLGLCMAEADSATGRSATFDPMTCSMRGLATGTQ